MAQSPTEGLEIVQKGLQIAKDHRADLAVFPEMTLIGYDHHLHDFFKSKDWYGEIRAGLASLAQSCDMLKVSALVGTPYQTEAGYLNAMVFLAPGEEPVLAGARKITVEGWRKFWGFAGPARKDPLSIMGVACGFIFCAEAGHLQELHGIGLENCNLIFWPSVTRNHLDSSGSIVKDNCREDATAIATAFHAQVIQSTYVSQISPLEENLLLGGAVITDEYGNILQQASYREEGFLVCDIPM